MLTASRRVLSSRLLLWSQFLQSPQSPYCSYDMPSQLVSLSIISRWWLLQSRTFLWHYRLLSDRYNRLYRYGNRHNNGCKQSGEHLYIRNSVDCDHICADCHSYGTEWVHTKFFRIFNHSRIHTKGRLKYYIRNHPVGICCS
jgi:hypothetical protein